MNAVILHDAAAGAGAAPDVDIRATLDAVEHALLGDGHRVSRLGADAGGVWMETLRASGADVVVNLCEGVDGVAGGEPLVAAALELLGVPFTGNASWTLALCLRKHAVNALLASAGVRVPAWARVRRGDPPPRVGYPAIVKPAAEDASIGVDQRSVVTGDEELADALDRLHPVWPELLVQRYVAGRELNVGVLGDDVLPASEISFAAMPGELWPIVTYASKWDAGGVEDLGARPVCPAPLDGALAAELGLVALRAWRLVGGRGYGRVDLRVDDAGVPWVLEVNANPDLAPDAGLARMAAAAGMGYGALVRRVCSLALPVPAQSLGALAATGAP